MVSYYIETVLPMSGTPGQSIVGQMIPADDKWSTYIANSFIIKTKLVLPAIDELRHEHLS